MKASIGNNNLAEQNKHFHGFTERLGKWFATVQEVFHTDYKRKNHVPLSD